jgi:hypothetical protein
MAAHIAGRLGQAVVVLLIGLTFIVLNLLIDT